MIEDKIQIDEEIKKLPFIEHYKKMWPFVKISTLMPEKAMPPAF